MVHQIWHQFPRIQLKLIQLEPYLLKAVTLSNQPVHSRILALLKSGGKLLRPGFFYIYSEFGENIPADKLRAGAAAIELLHVATLIHDDVIDQSPLRRGVQTIHTQYGQKNAIYAGDYLFTCYFDQVLKSTHDATDLQRHIEAMQTILNGELDQMAFNYRQDMSQKDYFHEITGKTAELFKLSFEQSAILTHAPRDIVTLGGEIGLAIGQAYQIQDDILDYGGDSSQTKKPVLEDLQSGVYTLPLILANQTAGTQLAPLLGKKQDLKEADIKKIQEIVIKSGGLKRAHEIANQLTQKTLALINRLPEQNSKKELRRLTNLLLQREQ
ncbi:polyprenyl synthetase family protein [Lentilactobacillus hilgardii]|uniref:polyprenyl synthetase family protein n=1 Tax=Lentilactobacillus hilgardii TaxID=1588 RepID=UPI0021A86642|nr:polyprenyl synthetase family protein [Lentilactobacillus hilgardii]MCT3396848.1 polyprenyl synthetase family protein [Lentilactobacillus hilgardii]